MLNFESAFQMAVCLFIRNLGPLAPYLPTVNEFVIRIVIVIIDLHDLLRNVWDIDW